MTPELYAKLSAQVARQSPELSALDADIAAAQPAIDSAQAWLDSCTSTHESAQAALDAARARPADAPEDWTEPDTSAQQAAFTATAATLETARADLSALTGPRDELVRRADAIRAAIAQCQAEMQASGLALTEQDLAAQALSETRAAAVRAIDADTDAIYGQVVGNRATEYAQAEADAIAYAEAGYTGAVPAAVASWATAKGCTAQQSADDILATAAQWRTAQASIRAQRLGAKEAVRTAASPAAVSAALAAWRGFAAQIRTLLGL